MAPNEGGAGISGWGFIEAEEDGSELQMPLLTLNVYVVEAFSPLIV